MSELGQPRRFDGHPLPSGLPSTPDIRPVGLLGSNGPEAEIIEFSLLELAVRLDQSAPR